MLIGMETKVPEAPEVRRIADVLEKVVGEYLTDLYAISNIAYKFCRDGISGSELLKFPHLIEGIVVKGKLIRIDLDQDLSILNTLGMSGTWKWGLGRDHARVILQMDNQYITFCDQRSFGNLKIVPRSEAVTAVKAIGWDLLQGPMPPKKWRELQKKKHFKDRPIGPALMEQNVYSGIGNIYKAEILYELKISPATKVKDVDPKIWSKVNTTAHKILKASYNAGGSSVRNYSAGGRKGTYQKVLRIYSKKKCPLGHDTAKLKQKSRNTWYCPKCQP